MEVFLLFCFQNFKNKNMFGNYCLLSLLSVIFRHPVSPRAVSSSFLRSPETPILPNQAKVTPPREHPLGKGQQKIIGDDPRSYAPGGKTLQLKNSQKAFPMRGRHLVTKVLKGDLPPKEVATKEGPFDSLGPRSHRPSVIERLTVGAQISIIHPRAGNSLQRQTYPAVVRITALGRWAALLGELNP